MAVTTKAMLFAAGLLMLAAGTASAAAVEVKVPFPFVVQGQTMPAGQYPSGERNNGSLNLADPRRERNQGREVRRDEDRGRPRPRRRHAVADVRPV